METKRRKTGGLLQEMDLTKGNLFWKIPLFALPLAIATMLQFLYTAIDLWTVAQFSEGGSNSMGSIGSSSPLVNLMITVFTTMSLGVNVVLANAKGANDKAKGEKVLHTSFIASALIGIAVGVFGAFMSRFFLQWMGTPDSFIDKATTYMSIYFIGMPFNMVYNWLAQAMRASGDTRKPFLILAVSGAFNILADLLFVIVFKWDVAGVAIATVISQFVSAAAAVFFLARNKEGFVMLNFRKLRVDIDALKEIMRIGVPAGLQGFFYSFPNMLIQSSLYTISIEGFKTEEIVDGAAAAAQIESFVWAVTDALVAACTATVGQNYGAKNKENIKKSLLFTYIWQAIACTFMVAIALIFSKQLLDIFIEEGQDIDWGNAVEAGRMRLYVCITPYFLCGVMNSSAGYLRGLKHSTPPAIVTAVTCTGVRVLFIITLFQLPFFHTISWLYGLFPITWVIAIVAYIPMLAIFSRKRFKEIDESFSSDAISIGVD